MRPGPIVRVRRLALAPVLLVSVVSAAQQPGADPLSELARLAEEVTSATGAVTADRGTQILDALKGLALEPAALEPAQRGQFLLCQVYAHLALGEAGAAATRLAELRELLPDDARTHRAAYLVACAAGDARLGAWALDELERAAGEDERRELSGRAGRMKVVGAPAPALAIKTEGGDEIALADRAGRALVLFLWNVRKEPSADELAAMKRYHQAYAADDRVQWIGVNADSARQTEKARAFVRSNGLDWPHHYEQKAGGAPITHRAFRAGSSPACAVVDADGIIRAVGDITEPGVEYAIRAAAAEAGGKFPPPESRGIDGKVAQRGAPRTAPESGQPDAERRADERRPDERRDRRREIQPDNKPDPAEAENLLRQAQLMLRTGSRTKARELLERIVSDYPDSPQAREARSMLENLP